MARQVLIASIKHETNTFSNRPADLAAFHARYCYRGEEIPTNMRGTKVEMAAFFDAGINTVWRRSQLTMNPSRLLDLTAKFPGQEFPSRVQLLPGTNRQIRSSTGLEVQVLLPVVNAPFRVYWAYNPNRLETLLAPPILINRSQFPNDATYRSAVLTTPRVFWREKSRTFRFSVGRTF